MKKWEQVKVLLLFFLCVYLQLLAMATQPGTLSPEPFDAEAVTLLAAAPS